MSDPISSADRAAIDAIVSTLEAAWNAGDGKAFAAPFAADADFVNIRADRFRGRDTIAAGHDGIFRSVYAGSSNQYTVSSVRLIRPDVALAHVEAALVVPAGPLAGRHQAVFSALLTREAHGWEIASFHNTLAPPAAGARPDSGS